MNPKNRAVGLIIAATAVFAANIVALSPIAAHLTGEGGMAKADVGWLFTSHFAGFIVFALAGGALSDRIGKKRVLVWALAGYAVGFVLFAFNDAFWAECSVMFVLGGCGGIIECLGAAWATDLDPEHPEAAVNKIQIFFALAALASPFVVSIFLEQLVFWKAFYLVLAGISAVLWFLLARTKVHAVETSPQTLHLKDFIQSLREPGFIAMALAMFAYTGAEVGAWGWLSSLLQQSGSFDTVQAGLGVALFWAAMTLGRYLCGLLLPYVRVDQLVAVLAAFTALVTFGAVMLPGQWWLLGTVAGIGLGCSSQFPLIAGYGTRLTKLPSGAAFSLLMVSGNLGAAVVPLGMGLVGDTVGLGNSLLLPAVLFGCVAVLMVMTKRPRSSIFAP